MNEYQRLMENIQTPAGLNDRVLFAARRQSAPKRRRKRPVFRAAVCAACALALVAGSVRLRPSEEGMPVPEYSFALTAYAAEAEAVNGALAFVVGEGMADPETGDFTGCLFQVTGEGIETVSLAIDRGGLYRYELHTDMTEDEIRAARQAMEEGTLATAAISQDDDGVWSMPEMAALGSSATEEYDPAARYGFWVPPEEMILDEKLDMRHEAQANIDRFDGAKLTVTVTFTGGGERSKTYELSTGRLRVTYEEDGTQTILPQLAGDDEPCVYGVYAVDQAESRWFSWPVQGANTVSLSNPYGKSSNGSLHDGIDIPAAEGTPVLAAADGTVTEVAFDAERGNYLVLDHGDGLTTLYGQCRNVDVKVGDTVKAGEMVGAVGATGMVTGTHLHFEVRQNEKVQNPIAYFDGEVRDTLRAE